jgi:hypothetical protein
MVQCGCILICRVARDIGTYICTSGRDNLPFSIYMLGTLLRRLLSPINQRRSQNHAAARPFLASATMATANLTMTALLTKLHSATFVEECVSLRGAVPLSQEKHCAAQESKGSHEACPKAPRCKTSIQTQSGLKQGHRHQLCLRPTETSNQPCLEL